MNRRLLIRSAMAIGGTAAVVRLVDTTFQAVAVSLVLVVALAIASRLLGQMGSDLGNGGDTHIPLLATAWLALTLLPPHSFVYRGGGAVLTSIDIQPVIELTYFTAAAALALVVIHRHSSTMDAARPPVALLILPIWIAATGFWGDPGIYSMVRAFQYLVFWFMGWATLCVGLRSVRDLDRLVSLYLRWFVRITLGLIVLGVALGPLRAPISAANVGRFTWFAAHPNSAGLIMSTAIVIIASAPKRTLRMPILVRLGASAALVVAMLENHSRASWACLVVGLAFVYLTSANRRPRLLAIGGPFLALGIALAAIFRWDSITDYVLRNESSGSITTGNGRGELWGIGLRSFEGTFDWWFGHGYGITRTLFLPDASWTAASAHNSLLAMLVGTGLVGAAIFLGTVLSVVAWTLRSRILTRYDLGRAAVAPLALMIVNAAATDVLAEPSLGIGLLYLASATVLVWRDPATRFDEDRADEITEGWRAGETDVFGRNAPSPADATSSASR